MRLRHLHEGGTGIPPVRQGEAAGPCARLAAAHLARPPPIPSCQRKLASSFGSARAVEGSWTPAFAGVTAWWEACPPVPFARPEGMGEGPGGQGFALTRGSGVATREGVGGQSLAGEALGDGFTMSISRRHGRIHSYPILGLKSTFKNSLRPR